MVIDWYLLVCFVIMGFLGAATIVLFEAKKKTDLYSFDSLRHLALGLIMGCLYYFLHSDWNFPNAVSSFVYGLAATYIVESIIERVKRKPSLSPA
jgi:hypothetical protein